LEIFIQTLRLKGAKHLDKMYPSTNPQETIDVSGAGDTFVSAFSLMYLKNNNISESITFANEVCSDVVNKKGVSLPDTKFISRLTF
jgi:sugar/nucleoside kinase (ribokinase family)